MIVININCEKFEFNKGEVKHFLENFINGYKSRGLNEAKQIYNKLNGGDPISLPQDIINLTEIFFLYNKSIREEMVLKENWYIIGSMEEAEKQKDLLQKKAKTYSFYRYEKDYGWLGVYAEEKTKNFFKEKLKIEFEEWSIAEKEFTQKEQWVNKIDRYDIKIFDKTVDIKCATQPHYIEITPKVIVENKVPKDIYIATKFFDDNNLYLIGFFEHNDITKYAQDQKYGADYYKVKIYEARCLKELFQ